jgi:hypothetical protein
VKKIKIIYSTDKENKELEIDETINFTLKILREVKAVYEWDDIEEARPYVKLLGVLENSDTEIVEIEDEHQKQAIKVLKGAMELKKINGVVLEKYVEVYEGITGDNI